MPFNEDYQNVMNTIHETGSTAAEVYAEKNKFNFRYVKAFS